MRPEPGHSDRRPPRPRRARGGFTLAELICATAMLGIVLMAGSALIGATTAGWRQTDAGFRKANLSDRAGLRIEETLGAAMAVLQLSSTSGGPASVFYWKSDGITGTVNGKAELGEMALIEFVPATKAILLYEPIATASMTAAQLAEASSGDWGDPTSAAVVAYYKSRGFIAAAQPLMGGATGESAVTSASFQLYAPAGAKPAVGYTVTMNQNGVVATRQGMVTLRAACKPRNVG